MNNTLSISSNQRMLNAEQQSKMKKIAKVFYTISIIALFILIAMNLAEFAFAETKDVFTTLGDAAKTFYNSVKGIATIVAIASIAVAIVVSFTSHNQKAVDTSRTIIKGIAISWAVLMLIGPIFDYAGSLVGVNNAGTTAVGDTTPKSTETGK